MHGKIVGGVFSAAPVTFVTQDGRTICNFHRRPKIMEKYGFKEVVSDTYPEYDPATEIIVPSYAEQQDGTIKESWIVTPMEDV